MKIRNGIIQSFGFLMYTFSLSCTYVLLTELLFCFIRRILVYDREILLIIIDYGEHICYDDASNVFIS